MNTVKAIITLVVFSLSFGGLAYAKNDKEKQLPPGLQKKVQSGKSLPPGWQKKLAVGETMEEEVYDHGKVISRDLHNGLVTISLEGKIVKVVEKTREIVEILGGL